jgi:hypothetical protein
MPRCSKNKANDWYKKLPWLCGVNYVPSTSVNTTEFWQAETFDEETIKRELNLASETGFNSIRVFIQYEVWRCDPEGMKSRFSRFLSMASSAGLSAMPVLFDDCAFNKQNPKLGKQDEPVPGKMMTSWTASPGHDRVTDRSVWPDLEKYVKDMIGTFAEDSRVLLWDIYNEPGNEGMGDKSLPLLDISFAWARDTKPAQPLTSGLWNFSDSFKKINAAMLKHSDVISFHSYSPLADTEKLIMGLEAERRPAVCTEWMARWLGSRIETHLPIFKSRGVGCYSWGLVNGRTQTHIGWQTLPESVRTDEWFHDLYHPDGRAYKPEEIAVIQSLAGSKTG